MIPACNAALRSSRVSRLALLVAYGSLLNSAVTIIRLLFVEDSGAHACGT